MNKFFFLIFSVLVFSCAPKKVNQYTKINGSQQRHGLWVEEYDADGGKLQAKGKYDKGEKIGVWKTNFKGKKYQKDKIKNRIIKTTVYHPNGKVMEKGQSRTDISANERHWYYFGDWKYYDETGKLILIRKYADGKKIDSLSFGKSKNSLKNSN